MKRALVCGAGGFIGGHLVKKLKREGYWVRGVDIMERGRWRGEGGRSSILQPPFSMHVTVDELVETVIEVAGKEIHKKHVEGPVGVQARNPSTGSGHRFSKARIHSIGWRAKVSLKACPEHSRRKGIEYTYPWIETQVKAARDANSTV